MWPCCQQRYVHRPKRKGTKTDTLSLLYGSALSDRARRKKYDPTQAKRDAKAHASLLFDTHFAQTCSYTTLRIYPQIYVDQPTYGRTCAGRPSPGCLALIGCPTERKIHPSNPKEGCLSCRFHHYHQYHVLIYHHDHRCHHYHHYQQHALKKLSAMPYPCSESMPLLDISCQTQDALLLPTGRPPTADYRDLSYVAYRYYTLFSYYLFPLYCTALLVSTGNYF